MQASDAPSDGYVQEPTPHGRLKSLGHSDWEPLYSNLAVHRFGERGLSREREPLVSMPASTQVQMRNAAAQGLCRPQG